MRWMCLEQRRADNVTTRSRYAPSALFPLAQARALFCCQCAEVSAQTYVVDLLVIINNDGLGKWLVGR